MDFNFKIELFRDGTTSSFSDSLGLLISILEKQLESIDLKYSLLKLLLGLISFKLIVFKFVLEAFLALLSDFSLVSLESILKIIDFFLAFSFFLFYLMIYQLFLL